MLLSLRNYLVLIKNTGLFSNRDKKQVIFTVAVQREKIRESIYQMRDRREYNFGIFESAQVGWLVISRYTVLKDFHFPVVSLAIQSMNVKTGRGIGTEAVRLVTKFAFEKVALHRVEAYVSPRNSGSIKVLEKSGYYPRRIATKTPLH